ncbi:MAG: NUDIX hydrolase [Bacteroidetes bacterium]|nr:NUDIX hydrolase [Bacteroidota bacterium]MBU1718112.1 NUDIX hydrolase [Bacteroidota bacterium]
MSFVYDYPRPMVCVDCIITRSVSHGQEVLLIQRLNEPFQGDWALPGGFIEMEETLMQSALRELHEETGLTGIALREFATYGNPGRDPRGRNISIVFWGEWTPDNIEPRAGDDAKSLKWHSMNNLPKLAFDHSIILVDFQKRQEPTFLQP